MPYTNWTVSSVLSGLFSLRLVNWSYICCSCFLRFQCMVWFLRVICEGICVHAGWSRCFMVDTNTCRALRCGQQTCVSPYLHVFSAWEKDKLHHSSKQAWQTQHKASCNMQNCICTAWHSTHTQHHKTARRAKMSFQVSWATCGIMTWICAWPGFDLDYSAFSNIIFHALCNTAVRECERYAKF